MVSVLVPNYNHCAYLEQRIDSIFNQSFSDFEVILLDDASTDNSLNILNKYSQHPKVSHVVINKENSGSPFKQWKKGMKLAKGDYIWIAESDDYCEPNFLEEIFNYEAASNLDLGLIYSQSVDVDEKGNIISKRLRYTASFEPNIWEDNFIISGKEFIMKFLKVKNVIPNASAVVFKKSLIDQSCLSKEVLDMKMCGDWLFWIKYCQNTNIGFISEPLNYFRSHDEISRNHGTPDKRSIRLIEESILRKHLKLRDVGQKGEIERLYKRWFDLHSLKDITKRKFYSIEIGVFSNIRILKKYFSYKLNSGKRA